MRKMISEISVVGKAAAAVITRAISACAVMLVVVACIALIVPLVSCGSKPDAVQALISRAGADPELRNEATFNELTELILASPDKYAKYITPDGGVALDRIEQAVNRAAHAQGEEAVWPLGNYGGALKGDLRLRIMLERSGSMEGYDYRGGSGNFKRAVSEMITRFPDSGADDESILIVNDDLYRYPGNFDTFVQDKEIFRSTSSLGNPAYTDFAKIFSHALSDTVPERITVLVTDLIYSPVGTEALTPDKIFNEESTLTSSLFKRHLDKSMLIVRLLADFRGRYYPYGGVAGFDYSGQRPYYMVITGSAAAMSKLRTSAKYASFIDFSSLPGFEHQYFFNRQSLPLPWWSLMPRRTPAHGEYSLSGGGVDMGAHTLKGVRGPAGGGGVRFSIAVDFSQIPAAQEYLLDPANYKIESDAVVSMLSVKPVAAGMADARTRRYIGKATHVIELCVQGKTMPSHATVILLNRLPSWINDDNAESDRNPGSQAFSRTTFGLLPFLSGVYQAYYGTANVPAFTKFTVKFEN